MSVVTPDIIRQVALLARLRLEGEALAHTAAQVDHILEYVKRLQAIPTEGVEPTSHVLPLANVMRPDSPQPSLSQEDVCCLSQSAQPPFIKVPKVIEA